MLHSTYDQTQHSYTEHLKMPNYILVYSPTFIHLIFKSEFDVEILGDDDEHTWNVKQTATVEIVFRNWIGFTSCGIFKN